MIPQRTHILGVPVDLVTMESTLDCVRAMLQDNSTHMILAVNPEKVIAAQRNPDLLQVLEDASLVIPDGIGVVAAARILGKGRMQRVPGADLMPAICDLAAQERHSVFLLGAKPEIVERAAVILQQRYPGLKVAGTQHGYVPESQVDELIETINASAADVLFVGLGSPRQELWMARYNERLDVKICQGVGGTFDAICGHPPRAPRVIQKLHLEWFYRLITQPQRLVRQTSLPRFVLQVVREAAFRK